MSLMRVQQQRPEELMTREGRAQLSLLGLLRLYLDPFPLFRDARVGDGFLRESSKRHNRSLAPVLRIYLARWALLMALCLVGCLAAQAAVPVHRLFVVLMMFSGIGVASSVAALCLLTAGYLLLTRPAERPLDHRR